ncbi:MAG: hypothetical protein JSV12_05635 [Candidatus Bathyarchaeota archaeon]|nr:MAG: hypothetical protein JSV12_05635 [Candidatus Bathyarchaeota archaeon]
MSKKKYPIPALFAIFALTISAIVPVLSVDYLMPNDFEEESWSKVIDYLEYVDVYAASHGKPRPPAGARANLYMTYVNHSGLQMLYAGLSNITLGLGRLTVTLPIQTFMMHYKTENQSKDVVTASSYIMLMAYNETADTTIYPDSPDRNDTLYASFSMGFDLSSLINTADRPGLSSKTTITPLTHSDDKTAWHWGMTYTNLTAIWWRVYLDPNNSSYQSVPVAVSVYEELTFTYDLIFNSDSNTATLVSNYVIGRMTDLWVVDTWWWVFPVIVHYNSTGCYRLNKSRYSNETICQFLHKHGISMSIVLFQASAILDQLTESSVSGQNVTDNEVVVSNDTISTFAEDGEKIFDTDFGEKSTYTLHNQTSSTSTTHNAVTRTAQRKGFAKNPVFQIHTFLMRYIPLALAHMDEPLYEQAKNHLLNMTYADYFYIISYPTYDGYKIEHDPTHIAYLIIAGATPSDLFAGPFMLILTLVGVAAIIVAISIVVILRRKPKPITPS